MNLLYTHYHQNPQPTPRSAQTRCPPSCPAQTRPPSHIPPYAIRMHGPKKKTSNKLHSCSNNFDFAQGMSSFSLWLHTSGSNSSLRNNLQLDPLLSCDNSSTLTSMGLDSAAFSSPFDNHNHKTGTSFAARVLKKQWPLLYRVFQQTELAHILADTHGFLFSLQITCGFSTQPNKLWDSNPMRGWKWLQTLLDV